MLPNDDGNQEQPTGGTESPTSSPSGSQGQQLSDVSALVKEVTELRKELRGLQKGADKRFERQDENIKRILELKDAGLSESQIKRELWIDQQIQGQDASPQAPAGRESARQALDVESFSASDAIAEVESYELSANDQSFIDLLRKNPSKQQVKDYILEKKKPTKPASVADVVQGPAKGGVQPQSPETLLANYKNEMMDARGKGARFGDALKDKYRALGVDVDNVHFTV